MVGRGGSQGNGVRVHRQGGGLGRTDHRRFGNAFRAVPDTFGQDRVPRSANAPGAPVAGQRHRQGHSRAGYGGPVRTREHVDPFVRWQWNHPATPSRRCDPLLGGQVRLPPAGLLHTRRPGGGLRDRITAFRRPERGRGKPSRSVRTGLPHSTTDVATYESSFRSHQLDFDGLGRRRGWSDRGNGTLEADSDIEQVSTQAPGASILSYEAPNTAAGAFDTWNSIVSADAAQVVSTSWGLCEPLSESAGFTSSFTTLFAEAAAQGQTILSAVGDSGLGRLLWRHQQIDCARGRLPGVRSERDRRGRHLAVRGR